MRQRYARVVVQSVTRIKVDIDGKLPDDIDDRLWWILTTLQWPVAHVSYYRTKAGWHIEVHVSRRVHPWRVVAVQAILGSDYRRETFNLRRTARWRDLPAVARARWNVLFTNKHALTDPTTI